MFNNNNPQINHLTSQQNQSLRNYAIPSYKYNQNSLLKSPKLISGNMNYAKYQYLQKNQNILKSPMKNYIMQGNYQNNLKQQNNILKSPGRIISN